MNKHIKLQKLHLSIPSIFHCLAHFRLVLYAKYGSVDANKNKQILLVHLNIAGVSIGTIISLIHCSFFS